MADVAGALLTTPTPSAGLPDRGADGYIITTSPYTAGSGLPDKRRGAYATSLGAGGGGPGPSIQHYKLRARDNGLGPPAVYREWESTDYTSSPPAPPPVGVWVEKTILAHWTT